MENNEKQTPIKGYLVNLLLVYLYQLRVVAAVTAVFFYLFSKGNKNKGLFFIGNVTTVTQRC